MSNREEVAAIRQAWRELMPEEPPITYGLGPAVDLDLYAQIAINVLTDWHKHSQNHDIHGNTLTLFDLNNRIINTLLRRINDLDKRVIALEACPHDEGFITVGPTAKYCNKCQVVIPDPE